MSNSRLPFPSEATSSANQQGEEVLLSQPSNVRASYERAPRQSQESYRRPEDFISTTTAPLRDAKAEEPPASRARTTSGSSASVLDRGRPRTNSRVNPFLSSEGQEDAGRISSDWPDPRPSGDWRRDDGDSEFEGIGRGRPSSFFGVGGNNGVESGYGEYRTGPAGFGPGDSQQAMPGAEPDMDLSQQPRRSSFYGLEAALPISQGDNSPSTSGTPYSHYAVGNLQNGGDSGSGSYSSHELGGRRYHSAPYAASRAASLYGIPAGGGEPVPVAPLLDHSHLQPGALASLLSHEKTLELYRTNAKKTNDPDIQFEFCTFVMEVVGEMEAATPEGQENSASKQKQQSLVSESVALLSKLASRGHVKSQYFLADCYTQGVGTQKGKRDYEKAFPLFVLAGKHGHADACFRAAQCCENGWGTKRKYSESVTLYRRAAVLNHPGAMHRLGLAEINGELNLSKRPREGVKWLKRAAELADQVDPPQPESLHELALLHERGIDNIIFKDEEYAAELLARASELGYAPSAYKLGECYEYGKMACPQDSALSIHYYNIAAQQNHREACFALTAWYLVGSSGVLPQSDTEAYLWARKAADMGLAKAQYAVGYFTEVGIGTYKDAREALNWFKKAADQGDKRAKDRLRMAASSGGPPRAFQREQPLPPQPENGRNNRSSAAPPPPPPNAYKPPPMTGTNRIQKQHKSQGKAVSRPSSVDRSQAPYRGNGNAYSDTEDFPTRPAPPFRNRSNSQPTPVDPYAAGRSQQYSYNSEDPYAAFNEVAPNYGRPPPQERQHSGQFKPIHPAQARMPQRQQLTASPVLGPEKEAERAAKRERVLQKRGAGEDKDCIVS